MPETSGHTNTTGHAQGDWTFLSNHSHVLICLGGEPGLTLREVAARVGITERAVQKIVLDLESGGFLTRHREGRCNRYRIHRHKHLRHPIEADRTLSDLLEMALAGKTGSRKRGKRL